MPKMKTHKSAAKRFKRRKSGQIVRGKTPKNHNLAKKSPKHKRQVRQRGSVSAADKGRVERMLGV